MKRKRETISSGEGDKALLIPLLMLVLDHLESIDREYERLYKEEEEERISRQLEEEELVLLLSLVKANMATKSSTNMSLYSQMLNFMKLISKWESKKKGQYTISSSLVPASRVKTMQQFESEHSTPEKFRRQIRMNKDAFYALVAKVKKNVKPIILQHTFHFHSCSEKSSEPQKNS